MEAEAAGETRSSGELDVTSSAGAIAAAAVAAVLATLSLVAARETRAQQPGATSSGWSTDVAPATTAKGSGARPQPAPEARPPIAVEPARSKSQTTAPAAPAVRSAPTGDQAAVKLTGDATRTRLLLDLTAETTASVLRLSSPWRVVIDLPATELVRPMQPGNLQTGLVTGVRAGLFAAGKLRVVLDTTGPVAVEVARVHPPAGGQPARLEVVLAETASAAVRAGEIAGAAGGLQIDATRGPEEAAPAKARPPRARPVIVVDPGHGGIDPGAQGEKAVEKDIVLAVGREVQRMLLAARRYDVVMTRSSDVFVALDQRVRISRERSADLFLSIHADSLDSKSQAQSVRGATVYTLADKATDARAALVAAKENASDLLAGLDVGAGDGDGSVRDILVDLMRRESANFSADFRKLLVGEMRPRLAVAREPYRSAPFKVLRQPGSPAVLIELGFISNAADEQSMLTQAWQRKVAEAVKLAVDAYFRRRTAEAPDAD